MALRVHRQHVGVRLRSAAIVAALIVAAWTAPAALGATLSVSPSGVDAASCRAPCRSVAYAFRHARPGDVVRLAGGSYGTEAIPNTSNDSGARIQLRRRAGAAVAMDELNIRDSNVSVIGVRANRVSIDAGNGGATPVVGVTLRHVVAKTMWIQSARDLLVKGGSFGGNTDRPTVQTGGNPASSNLVFDGVDFHDAVATNSTVHMECFWAGGIQGLTVRNSIFRNCAYFDIFFTTLNGPDPRNVLLENNVFETTKQWNGQDAPYAVNVANWLSKAENFTFRNNTFDGDIAIQPTRIVNMRLAGNIGAVASCTRGVEYSHNIWRAAKCAGTDRRMSGAMSQFVNPAGHDWHLKRGAAAINAGDPNDYPATDRDGLARRGAPDAGAHEYQSRPRGNGTQPRAPRKRRGIVRLRLSRHVVCRHPNGKCRGTTALNVVLGSARGLRVALRHGKRVKRIRRRGHRGSNVLRIRARTLKRGRYTLLVRAVRAGHRAQARRLVLRVR